MSQLRPISEFKAPAQSPAPPVSTRHQALPFDQLQWEAFEALCLKLVEAEARPEFCRFYGERGDAQAGIDFYARRSESDRYRVYQCKKVKEFGPADVRAVVEDFLNGELLTRSESLTLCAAVTLRRKKVTDEIEAARERLRAKGVAFEVWDSDFLSGRLKSRPELVGDFFGAPWVEAFCGSPAPTMTPWWLRRTALAVGVLAVGLVVGLLAWNSRRAADPSLWLRFETISVYRVIPDPTAPAEGTTTPRDAFVGIVLEVKNESKDRAFEVQDLRYEGDIGFEPAGPGGLLSDVEALGQPPRVVGGGNLGPRSRATVAIVFPFIHSESSPSPTGGVLPVFPGRWTLIVDGHALVVAAKYKSEGTVLRSKWNTVVEVPGLKLQPILERSTIPDPWRRTREAQ